MHGINYEGLRRESYDGLVNYINRDENIKYPNRLATMILNSHYLAISKAVLVLLPINIKALTQ